MSTIADPAIAATEDQEHFLSLLKKFHTAMLVTHSGLRGFHARPMAIVKVEDDGRMWFFTAANTAKVHEIENDADVHLTAQDGDSAFLSIIGSASLVTDREKVAELSSEPFRVWFPEGKDDPNIELIAVRPAVGEFWDNTGVNRCKYMWEATKAYLTGMTPKIHEGDNHGVVRL